MANINAYIEQAIRGIENEREHAIAGIKATIMRDKVVPQNAEIDTARDMALQELQVKLNADISALQEKFAKDRQEIIEAGEKQKKDNENMLIGVETASITKEYDEGIAALRKLLIKE